MTLTLTKPDDEAATETNAAEEAPQTPTEVDSSAATETAEGNSNTEATNTGEAAESASVCPLDAAELFKLQDRINEAASREHAAKENYSIAKKNREAAQAALSEYIEEMRQPSLFTKPADSTKKIATSDPEPWRKTTIEELSIPEQITEKLRDHHPQLITLGAIADFTMAGNQLTDVKGIGEAKAAQIEGCINNFWESYSGPRSDTEAAPEPEENDEDGQGDDSDSEAEADQ